MRKSLQFVSAAAIVVLVVAIVMLVQKNRKATSDYAELQFQEQTTRDRYGQAINEIATIQDSLNGIALGDSAASLMSAGLQSEARLTESQSDRALARISVIKAGLERTKQRIVDLDERLKQNGVKISGLNKMVANLKRTVAEKELMVAELAGRVDSLQTQVAGLSTEVQQQTVTIEDKRRELGTVYYAIGSKKDLTASGVVEAKGGVLGIGKTLKPTGRVDERLFTPIDTDAETVIHIPATKAQVVSAQPPGSYQLTLVGNELELRIIEPREFRTVKQVVIVTT